MRNFILGIFFTLIVIGILLFANHERLLPLKLRRFRHHPSATPKPTPRPKPTPIRIPNKRMNIATLFNGIKLHTHVETMPGGTAVATRDLPSSYVLDLNLKIAVPKANTDLQSLQSFNSFLPTVLPELSKMISPPHVSPFYQELYRLKVDRLKRNIVRLDRLLSRYNFFDCETILDLKFVTMKGSAKQTRHALLIQTDMDVDMDGSDGDRVSTMKSEWLNFQPMTSYRWKKKTDKPNPYLAASEVRLKKLLAEPESGSQKRAVSLQRDLIYQLKHYSFLIGVDDPYIVLPGSMFSKIEPPYRPHIGDFCVAIYKDTLYPAIVGDVGPTYKIGEASYRLCQEINARSTAYNSPVSDPKITYIVFPGTAKKPFGVPNLDHWRDRCKQLLDEIGGYKGTLFSWKDLTKPKPTPTPSPTPKPTPSPTPKPTVSPTPKASPSPAASLLAKPKASPTTSPLATPTATPVVSPLTSPSPTPAKSPSA